MNKHSLQLGTESIKKLLVKLSLPATIGMIVNALYNLVDTIFIGRGVGYLGIAGLSIAFPIQMILMAFSFMVGIGASSAVSRSLGENNLERAEKIAGNSYVMILIIVGIMVTIGYTFTDPILRLFGATDNILPYSRDYIQIILGGSIFFSFAMSSNNLIRSEGNAKVAMLAMIIGTGLNIILDPIFIFVFDMGIKGAAWATIISQFISFLYVLSYFRSGKSSLKIKPHHLKLEIGIFKEIIAVGLPAFVRQVNGSILAVIMNNTLGTFGGDIAITVYGIINRVMMFLLMPLFGVVQGMQPIVGFNYGAKKYDRVKETVKISILVTTMFASAGWILSQLFPEVIIRVFTTESEVISLGTQAIHYIFLAIPVIGIQIISGSLFQAIGKAKPAFVLSILRQMLILIPLVLILPRLGFGLIGVFVAFPVSDVISTIISGFILKHEIDKMHL
ncbi:MAG: MATE family efflux transporter [Clostridiales bacterium]|nr:MATE family efflux transporter [Clostridiales bacterium]